MAAVRCDHCGRYWVMAGDLVNDYVTPAACPYCGERAEFSVVPGQFDWDLAPQVLENGWAEPKGKA